MQGELPQSYLFTLRGLIRNPLSFSVPGVDFAKDEIGGTRGRSRSKRVEFEGLVDMEGVEVAVEPPLASAVAILRTKRQGSVRVSPRQDVPPGPYRCEVIVKATSARDGRLIEGRLPVRGVVWSSVEIRPCIVSFPPAAVGSRLETTVSVRSRSEEAFSVEGVSADDDTVSVELIEEAFEGKYRYRIGKLVSALGSHSDAVNFVVQSDGEPRESARLVINSIGIAGKER